MTGLPNCSTGLAQAQVTCEAALQRCCRCWLPEPPWAAGLVAVPPGGCPVPWGSTPPLAALAGASGGSDSVRTPALSSAAAAPLPAALAPVPAPGSTASLAPLLTLLPAAAAAAVAALL